MLNLKQISRNAISNTKLINKITKTCYNNSNHIIYSSSSVKYISSTSSYSHKNLLNKNKNIHNYTPTKNIFNLFKSNDKNTSTKSTNTTDETNKSTSTNTSKEDNSTSVFNLQESIKYAEDKVKKGDFYAYVIGSTLPPKLKHHYFAYHAFFCEVLRSRYISKEQSIGRMRLTFWEDSLKEISQGKDVKEPILIVLKESLKETGIRKDTLHRMIDFLFFDIDRQGEIKNMEDLEVFAENTRSLLYYLGLNLLHVNDKNAYIAASHMGRGVGIVDCLKKMPGLQKTVSVRSLKSLPSTHFCYK